MAQNSSTMRKRFLSLPPLRRILALLVVGVVLVGIVLGVHASRRPKELPDADSKKGLASVEDVIRRVGASGFGRTPRGEKLTRHARELLQSGRIRFTDALEVDALYRKERIGKGVLYIVVTRIPRGIEWPTADELARRVYHETLHAVVDSWSGCKEEECDGFCAAEEAAAAIENRAPQYPVMRDGDRIWDWVATAYPKVVSNPRYRPVGYTLAELAKRTGITHTSASSSNGNPR